MLTYGRDTSNRYGILVRDTSKDYNLSNTSCFEYSTWVDKFFSLKNHPQVST